MRKINIKLTAFALLVFVLALLAGCSGKEEDNTLRVVVPAQAKFDYVDRLEDIFPEIDFEFEYYLGGNTTGYLMNTINNGEAGDLILSTIFVTNEDITQNLLDLSGYNFTGNIRDEVLSLLNVNDAIYQIPGPIDVRCIVYNKTMFEEHGWEVPEDFADLVLLAERIRKEEPEITPIANCLTGGYPFTTVTTLSQCDFLSTEEGYLWEEAFFNGEASVSEGFAQGLAMTEELIRVNAFGGEEYVGKWNSNQALVDRACAMEFRWADLSGLLKLIEEQQVTDEFGLLPFYGANAGDKLISFAIGSAWSVNAALGEPGQEKKLENALTVMEWLTTAEAQEVMRTNETQIAINQGYDVDAMSEYYNELMEKAGGGTVSCMLYHGYEHLMTDTSQVIIDAILNQSAEGMTEKFIEVADTMDAHYHAGNIGASYGETAENFTEEETAKLLAKVLLESTGSDVALITHTGKINQVRNNVGAAGKLFPGFLTAEEVNMITCATGKATTYGIVTLELTGEEIETLLAAGKTMADETGDKTAVFPYYKAGTDNLEKQTVYQVAMQLGDYEDSLDTKVTDTGLDFKAEIEAYIRKHTPLTP